jgi:hypothetical protein
MTVTDGTVRLGKSIEFYRNATRNFVEFSRTDKRSKPQLLKRLAALETEAGQPSLKTVLPSMDAIEESPRRGKPSGGSRLTPAEREWILGKKKK